MKNSHLIPPAILDVISQLEAPNVRENERMALIQRLEATRDVCASAIEKSNRRFKK